MRFIYYFVFYYFKFVIFSRDVIVNATNMEIKPDLIHLVQSNQFNGLSHENPYTHLAIIFEICNTVQINQV